MMHHNRKLRDRVQLLIDEVLHTLGNAAASEADTARGQTLQLARLEDRLLMSASPTAVVAEMATMTTGSDTAFIPEAADPLADGPGIAASDTDATSGTADNSYRSYTIYGSDDQEMLPSMVTSRGPELIVIDSRVEDADTLLTDLLNADRDFRLLRLDPDEDGLKQITEKLGSIGSVSAIHLISHGRGGDLQLGATTLNAETLPQHAAELIAWQHLLTDNADLFVYGCDVAAGQKGVLLVDALSKLTGADIASSVDKTGAASLGGDWILEHSVGNIDTQLAFSQTVQSEWLHTLDLVPTAEFQVNSTTIENQTTKAESRGSQNAVAIDDAGNYVVVWTSRAQDGSNDGVYARRFGSDGIALTAEIQVNTYTIHKQTAARVASDAFGNFVVTWTSKNQDGVGTGVYARRFAADGTALTSEFRVNETASGDQKNSVIAMNRDGQFVIAWEGNGPGDSSGVFLRRYAADGTALDLVDRLANAADRGSEQDPTVAIDTNGNSVVFWEVSGDLYFQRFDNAGSTVGSDAQVDLLLSTASRASVAMDGSGNFTVVYREDLLVVAGVWSTGYNADGTVRYASFQTDTGDSNSPSIAMAADGTHIITYHKTGDGNGTGIYARKYNSDGSAAGLAFQVNQYTSGSQTNASIAMSSATDYVIVWSGEGATDSVGVFARQVGTANSAPVITSNAGGSSASLSITENAAVVTTVTASDAGLPSQTLTYSLSGGADAAKFSIDTATGMLTFVAAPNFEVPSDAGNDNIYNVTVQVDDGTLTDTQAVAVTVKDVNEAPSAVRLSNSVIVGYTPGDVAGTLAVADPDVGDTFTYAVSDARFEVDSSQLRLKSGVQIDPINETSVTLTVTATDSGNASFSRVFSLTVFNPNTAPVVSLAPVRTTIPENTSTATAVRVADILITDDAFGTRLLTLTGTDAASFQVVGNGLFLKAGTVLNFEAKTLYAVVVQVDDPTIGSSPDSTASYSLLVTNVNEAPVATVIADLSVPEDAPATGFSIASAFSDPDGDVLSYGLQVVGQSSSLFSAVSVNQFTGQLNYSLRANAFGSAFIRITATDPSGAVVSSQFSVFVQPVNDAPRVSAFHANISAGSTLTSLVPGVLSGAVDAEQSPLQAVVIRQPSFGTLVFLLDGSFTYQPDNNFYGIDSFTFAATDGVLTSNSATSTIQVLPPGGNAGDRSNGGTDGSGGASGGSASDTQGGASSGAKPPVGAAKGNHSGQGMGGSPVPSGVIFSADTRATDDDDAVAPTADSIGADTSVVLPTDAQDSAGRTFVMLAAQESELGHSGSGHALHRTGDKHFAMASAGSSALSEDDNALRTMQAEREIIYRNLAATNNLQMESFEEQLSHRVGADARVVGSVGVVTTGFSVGYLLWAVRGGMLLSGVLAQIPAWTMLDPLLVIDGNPKDDDKESLQTLMDRQQAKLTPKTTPPAVIGPQKAVVI